MARGGDAILVGGALVDCSEALVLHAHGVVVESTNAEAAAPGRALYRTSTCL
jgi:hypothetical protein